MARDIKEVTIDKRIRVQVRSVQCDACLEELDLVEADADSDGAIYVRVSPHVCEDNA